MATNVKNYTTINIGTFAALAEKERIETGKALGLTGCEMSLNSLPAGQSSSFLHSHKLNEEVYVVISGGGFYEVDGEKFPITEGSIVRVAPAGVRGVHAGDAGLVYLCIQAEAGSLTQCTANDGVIIPIK